MSRERDDFTRFLPGDWLWPPQGKQPLGIGKLPQIELRAAKARLQAARIGHLRDLLILREPNGIEREHRGLVLDFERAL